MHGSKARVPASLTRRFFGVTGPGLKVRMELGSNEAIKQTVAGRMGISILSQSAVRAELASGDLAVLDVVGLPLQRQWHLVHPKDKLLAPAATAFRSFLTAPRTD